MRNAGVTGTPDIIITNGRLLTMADGQPRAEALAIAGDRILAVGDRREIEPLRGPKTRVIDAGGGTVLPGFVESHMHLFGGAAELDQLNLEKVQDLDELTRVARDHAAKRPDTLILAGHASYSLAGHDVPLTRHHLDRVMPDRPFAIMASDHHTVWANTPALKLAGLLHGAALPPGHSIIMADDGLASGELREAAAFAPILAHTATGGRDSLGYTTGGSPVPPPGAAEFASDIATLKRGLRYCAGFGITSIHNMDGNFYQLELLDRIRQEGELPCRVQVPFLMHGGRPLGDLAIAEEMRDKYRSEWLYSGRVKIFLDGVLDSRSAFLTDQYPDDIGGHDDPLLDSEQYNEMVIEADRRGLQISTHAIGDGAVKRALDGYRAAALANGSSDRRHRIEHAEVIALDDLPRFRELGVIAAMQPLHAPGVMGMPLEPTLSRIAAFKRPGAYAWRSLRDHGATVVFASDWPVTPLDPMRSIQGAMTRRRWASDLPDHRQTLLEVLASYTRDGAYAEFRENDKGQLRPGMLADVAVLSRDLERTEADEMGGVRCVLTLCGGRVTFEA